MGETHNDDGTPKMPGVGNGKKATEMPVAYAMAPIDDNEDSEAEENWELITTNDQMDIDPVSGQRKRKRVKGKPQPQPEKVDPLSPYLSPT